VIPGTSPELELLSGQHPGLLHKIKKINNKTIVIIELGNVPIFPLPSLGSGSKPLNARCDTESGVCEGHPQ
jgi:hypothetical protein